MIRLTKVQILAEFVIDRIQELEPDYDLEPGTYGPVTMTPREWTEFNLQEAIEKSL